MGKRYIGIDPSTKTGFVVLNEKGEVIKECEITSEYEGAKRLVYIISKVCNAVLKHLKEPNIPVAIEGFSYNSKGKNVDLQYGIGWGIRTELFRQGIPYIDIPPASLKKFASNNGNVSKRELAVKVKDRWGHFHKSDNVTDAYVLAQIARYRDMTLEATKFQQEVLKKIG